MTVHVVILDPQGSMGGFDWFYEPRAATEHLNRLVSEGIAVLGIYEVEVIASTEPDEITLEIDAILTELERALGYDPEPA